MFGVPVCGAASDLKRHVLLVVDNPFVKDRLIGCEFRAVVREGEGVCVFEVLARERHERKIETQLDSLTQFGRVSHNQAPSFEGAPDDVRVWPLHDFTSKLTWLLLATIHSLNSENLVP